MQLMFRNMKCDEMYNLKLNWLTLNKILDLMKEYKDFDKDPKDIKNSILVVFADCLGDLMGESSDAFYIATIPNILFIDPYSSVDQWVLIAHELIHYLQQNLYISYEGIDEDLEDMAYNLQYQVKNILCKAKAMDFTFITDNPNIIDNIIEQVKALSNSSKVYAFEDGDGINYLNFTEN